MSWNSTHTALATIGGVTIAAIFNGVDLSTLTNFYAAVGAYAGIREAIRITKHR